MFTNCNVTQRTGNPQLHMCQLQKVVWLLRKIHLNLTQTNRISGMQLHLQVIIHKNMLSKS